MPVALGRIAQADYVVSNKRHKVRDITFSGNYTTGGETITAAQVGLKKIEQVVLNGAVAVSTDLATSNPVGVRVAATGLSAIVTQYEGSAAGTALSEKTNAEVYATGSTIRATFVGF